MHKTKTLRLITLQGENTDFWFGQQAVRELGNVKETFLLNICTIVSFRLKIREVLSRSTNST